MCPLSIAVPAVSTGGAADLRIHQTPEGPLRLLLPVRRQRKVFVLHARIHPERALESIHCANNGQPARQPPENLPKTHTPFREDIIPAMLATRRVNLTARVP